MVSGERSGDSDELHKPISQDDARLLRIERLAQVKRGKMCNKSSFLALLPPQISAHRLDNLDDQEPKGKSSIKKDKRGPCPSKLMTCLCCSLLFAYLLIVVAFVAILVHGFDVHQHQDPWGNDTTPTTTPFPDYDDTTFPPDVEPVGPDGPSVDDPRIQVWDSTILEVKIPVLSSKSDCVVDHYIACGCIF